MGGVCTSMLKKNLAARALTAGFAPHVFFLQKKAKSADPVPLREAKTAFC